MRKALAIGLLLSAPLGAEELRFDAEEEWALWSLPLGAVELRGGSVRPVRARKNTNASLEALAFGGGVRGAGSNGVLGLDVLDGDGQSGWAPDWDREPEHWWLEIDLGRVVSARQVKLVFAADGPPFEIFDLLLSTGEQARDNARVPIAGTVVYRIRERFSAQREREAALALEERRQTPVRYVRVQVLKGQPGARLAEIQVEALGDNLVLGLLQRGGSVEIVVEVEGGEAESIPLGNALGVADGDLVSRWNFGRASRGETDINARMTLDLGAVFRIDQVRMISHVVLGRGFNFKFYEVLSSDGSLSPDGTLIWEKHFSGHASDQNNWEGLVDHLFPLTPARYVRIAWKFWDSACAVALGGGQFATSVNCAATGVTEELQVFGEGFPREVRLRSPLLDLGGVKSPAAVHWAAHTPPGTRLEVRSRSGTQLREFVAFHDKDGREITQRRWERLIPSFRGRVDTTFAPGADWSGWSRLYPQAGASFLSPAPRRFAELEVRLVCSQTQAPELDWIALEFTDPLALGALAEVFPVEVEAGVEREFSCFVRADQTQGFDRLLLEASTPLHFAGAHLGGEAMEVEVEETERGVQLLLPRRVRSGEEVELRFAAAIYVQATRFELSIEDSRSGLRQKLEEGDASARVESSTLSVRLPPGGALFADLSLAPKVLTPNGDGINDVLRVELSLVEVLEARPLRLRVYDLAGRLRFATQMQVVAGRRTLHWDGRDRGGGRVEPGLYLVEVELEGDARAARARQVVGVVY